MLVNMKNMLEDAVKGGYAIGHFNINNLEWTKAILVAATECNSPVILGVSEGAAKYMGSYNTVVGMVNGLIKDLRIKVPIALHLDHGSYNGTIAAIKSGFSSVMFDGSGYSIDENLVRTMELVELANKNCITLEAEVGAIGGEEDGIIGEGEIASADECKQIATLGITALAAGIGNIHGKYPENWKGLNFDALADIKKEIKDMPLVLHGGTGISDEMIKKAIQLGVAKVNVNTECQIAFAQATRSYIENGSDLVGKGFDPRKLLYPGYEAIKQLVTEKIILFGSDNKA
ncbi:class II fructose-1,6-bisphosphate aldolase [Anaerocolumna xylanovorans]|uniref:Fructose-bisphosphate aldolase, class II n=1 Tax=Anaerocolumna xylanovorans DSM 12503 TaxID=1121345 RepID=A0A1M7YLT1_9FIRM|nr:class II fructose-1,6-bisphosphate aldolase [Anaerocolumna xylanovorans]SHO53551.1 fructose-bisphosphate aldolase, class II [Anaerocolumna xylanovorans DSM 12503]